MNVGQIFAALMVSLVIIGVHGQGMCPASCGYGLPCSMQGVTGFCVPMTRMCRCLIVMSPKFLPVQQKLLAYLLQEETKNIGPNGASWNQAMTTKNLDGDTFKKATNKVLEIRGSNENIGNQAMQTEIGKTLFEERYLASRKRRNLEPILE